MIKLHSSAPPFSPSQPQPSTIFRDIRQGRFANLALQVPHAILPGSSRYDDSAATSIFFCFATVTLWSLTYSLILAHSLFSGDALEQAVRAIVR